MNESQVFGNLLLDEPAQRRQTRILLKVIGRMSYTATVFFNSPVPKNVISQL